MDNNRVSLFIGENQKQALLESLKLYTGNYPERYSGALYFSDEANQLLSWKLRFYTKKIVIPSYIPGTKNYCMYNINDLSAGDIMAIVRSLQIYTGKFLNAYRGANTGTRKFVAEKLLEFILNKYHSFINHLL